MKEKHQIQNIYNELLELRIIENQTDFSVMCGRTPAWFSCLKARRLPITTDAALTLAYKLRRKARISICPIMHTKLIEISDAMFEIAEHMIEKKIALDEKCADNNESI